VAIYSGTLLQCTQSELTRGWIIKTSLSFKCSYVNRSLGTVLKTGGWQFQKFTLTQNLPTILVFCLRPLSNPWIYIYKKIILDRNKVNTIPIFYKCLQSCQLLSDSAEWHMIKFRILIIFGMLTNHTFRFRTHARFLFGQLQSFVAQGLVKLMLIKKTEKTNYSASSGLWANAIHSDHTIHFHLQVSYDDGHFRNSGHCM
jgi:hypothetical protein